MDFVVENYVFFLQFNLGDSLYSSNENYPSYIKAYDILNDYTINNIQFNQIFKVFEKYNQQEMDQPTLTYYSKGVGLIRKELLDSNEVWNLVNYHIEQ